MKLLTHFELASKPRHELQGLLRHLFNELAKAKLDSHERTIIITSIKNIQHALQTPS